jgi:hypothetical protein
MPLSALRGLLGCGVCFHPPCSADVGEGHAMTSVPVGCKDNTVLEVVDASRAEALAFAAHNGIRLLAGGVCATLQGRD